MSSKKVPLAPTPALNPYRPEGRSEWNNAFGDTTLRKLSDQLKVKGNLVRSRSRYLRDEFGLAIFDAVAARLKGEPLRFLVDPPLVQDWCDYRNLIELDCVITEVAMKDDVTLMKKFGFTIAMYDIPTVYQVLLKLSSPARVLRYAGVAWNLYFKPGKMVGEVLSANNTRMTLSDSVLGRYLCEFGIAGWMEATVAMSGAIEPCCEHTKCRHRGDPVCEWVTNWT
jgi:hypothetical protein